MEHSNPQLPPPVHDVSRVFTREMAEKMLMKMYIVRVGTVTCPKGHEHILAMNVSVN